MTDPNHKYLHDKIFAGKQVGVSAYKSSGQSITVGNTDKVTFDTEEWDLNDHFASSTFTVPPHLPGRYRVSGKITFEIVTASDQLNVWIYKNDGAFDNTNETTNTVHFKAVHFNRVLNLAAGDTVDIYARNNTSTDTINEGQAQTILQIEYVGKNLS